MKRLPFALALLAILLCGCQATTTIKGGKSEASSTTTTTKLKVEAPPAAAPPPSIKIRIGPRPAPLEVK